MFTVDLEYHFPVTDRFDGRSKNDYMSGVDALNSKWAIGAGAELTMSEILTLRTGFYFSSADGLLPKMTFISLDSQTMLKLDFGAALIVGKYVILDFGFNYINAFTPGINNDAAYISQDVYMGAEFNVGATVKF